MSWRPNGKEWAMERSKWFDKHFSDSGVKQKAYEAGADEIIKELRKEGFNGKLIVELFDKHTDVKETAIYLDTIMEMMKRYKREQIVNGTWVFIPDEGG